MTAETAPAQDEDGLTERDPRPIVGLPSPGLPGAAIAALAAVLALLLFLMLDGRRRHAEPVSRPVNLNDTSAFPSPPPLVLPPTASLDQRPAVIVSMVPPLFRRQRAPDMPADQTMPIPPPRIAMPATPPPVEASSSRGSEPALVLDNGAGVPATSGGPGLAQGGGNAAISSDDAPIRTTVIRNRTTIMPVGTVIPAVLETPIDSARPGLVRAIVSEDARGFDGKRVLIPRGSRLIGEYQSDVRSGQNRVLVTWTRLIRPDGVAIRIGSPAADALGGAGIPGHVNTYFFQRFAGAVLQSALQVGVNLASRPGNGSVIVGLPGNNVGTLGQDLLPANDLKPKIKVRQGAVMDVFVARDLDFSDAPTGPRNGPE